MRGSGMIWTIVGVLLVIALLICLCSLFSCKLTLAQESLLFNTPSLSGLAFLECTLLVLKFFQKACLLVNL